MAGINARIGKLKELMEKDVPFEFYADRNLKMHEESANPLTYKVEGNKLVIERGSGFRGPDDRREMINKIVGEIEKEGLHLNLKKKGRLDGNKWEIEFE